MPAEPTNPIGAFIVGRLLAERAGLSSTQTTQWGAVLMATGLSPASILLVTELARLDAENSAAQAEQQIQLRDSIQQATQKSQEVAAAAILAVEKLEQVTDRLDQLSDRLTQLEAQLSTTCTQATCTEILTTLRELRVAQESWGICSRRSRQKEHPISSWFRHLGWMFTRLWARPSRRRQRSRKR